VGGFGSKSAIVVWMVKEQIIDEIPLFFSLVSVIQASEFGCWFDEFQLQLMFSTTCTNIGGLSVSGTSAV
jgi:hypothetical protein